MEESYKIIFDEAMLCEDLRKLAEYFAVTDRHFAVMLWNEVVERLTALCRELSAENNDLASGIMNAAVEAKDSFDDSGYMQFILEMKLIPGMMKYLDKYRSISVDDGVWEICGTPSGFVSLKHMETGIYCHSAYDPMNEAYLLARNLYEIGMKDYYFFGCGLGYLPYQMWKVSNGSVKVHMYEYKSEIIEYARLFGPIDLIDEDMMEIRVFSDIDSMVKEYMSVISGENKYNSFPSEWFQSDVQKRCGDILNTWFATYRTESVSKDLWRINQAYNRKLVDRTHLDIPPDILKSEWVVVAAGPSFDDNIDFLRDSIGKKTVIAVSTVIPRLERENIRPDILIVCDPYDSIYPHVSGHEAFTEGIPLIAHAQTYWKFMKAYRGPIYLMAQAGDEKDTETQKYPEWNGGGTVTSMAIEAACLMGAEKIYVIGMDLAYPGGVRYSKGMNDQDDPDTEDLPIVRSNDGTQVYSAYNFTLYAKQIVDQVKYHHDIEMWNLSKHGIYIPMMRTGRWWEDGVAAVNDPIKWLQNIRRDEFLNRREKYYLIRQLIDQPGIRLTDEADGIAMEMIGELTDEMVTEFGLRREKCIKTGRNLEVIIASSFDEKSVHSAYTYLDNYSTGNRATLIINTRERLSGEKVYLKEALSRDKTPGIPSDGMVSYKGNRYAYYQLPDLVTSANQYDEILEILIGQNGIGIQMADKYSLFGAWVNSLIKQQ